MTTKRVTIVAPDDEGPGLYSFAQRDQSGPTLDIDLSFFEDLGEVRGNLNLA